MSRMDTLHKINELLFTELLEVRSKVKKKIMEDYDRERKK